ncbi:lysozyme inhibitor LprI family protein [Sphingomonas bacterium]|uniref:lysozyme inhibitor LprI family protein n=1 Tax=Sphingomonas bacterium TaxID=1895847 RepID=UPI001576F6C1|nr:lysozyme inhibitor LprI family protein [Sphingomonas bacterium]
MTIVATMLLAGAPIQTQADLNQRALDAWGQADAAMNAQYRVTMAAMKRLDGDPSPDNRLGYAAAMLASQRAWLSFRDADCVVEGYGMRGGSAEPAERSFCMTRLTRARTSWLKAQTR